MAGRAKLGRKKEEAIAALLTQRNVEEAAHVSKVGTRTLYRWMKEPDFEIAYREARRTAFGQSTARLQQMSPAAVSTLGKIMVDPNVPAASRVRAAHYIWEGAARGIELEDVEARVHALERAAETLQASLKK